MTTRTTEVIAAEQDQRAAAALDRVPAPIAALIERAPCKLTLCFALDRVFNAARREDVARAGGYFDGLVFATQMAAVVWTAEEFTTLTDYGHLAESTALLSLVEE